MLPDPPEDYRLRMPRHAEAPELRSVGYDSSGRETFLAPAAAAAWLRMRQAAAESGVGLVPVSGFRSVARQRELLEAKLASGDSWAEILLLTAYPGFSEHHSGRAIDIGAPDNDDLGEAFAATAQFAWLEANAHRFGFGLTYHRNNPFGIAYEPWHWCFAGGPASQSA
jgi:D-alanyl-D-alanine carboxypeptidase